MPVSLIQFEGRNIVYADYTQCDSAEDTVGTLEEVELYVKELSGRVLMLVEVPPHLKGSKEYMREARRARRDTFDDKIERWAIIGLNTFNKVLLRSYNVITSNKLMDFERKEQALRFLVD